MAHPTFRALPLLLVPVACACGGDERGPSGASMVDGGDTVPDAGEPTPMVTPIAVLGGGAHTADGVQVDVIVDQEDGLRTPRDLAFNPAAPEQLWVVNHANHSMIVVFDAGTPEQSTRRFAGFGNSHFMVRPSGIAFADDGFFATAHEEDEPTQSSTPADFMGPTLWDSDLMIFDGGHAGHMDMLHNSPNAMGVAWDQGNAYWVFDGYHSSITRYDFRMDHGPAGEDHSDGVIQRFVEGEVKWVEGISSHLQQDHATKRVYIADTGNARIAVLDPTAATLGPVMGPNYDGADMNKMAGATLTTLVDGTPLNLTTPSGLELHDGRIFVSDAATAAVHAFDMEGRHLDYLSLEGHVQPWSLQGIAFDAAGNLYVVDSVDSRVLRVSPKR